MALVAALGGMPKLDRLGVLAFLVARELDVGTHPIVDSIYAESAKRRAEHAAKLEARRKKRRWGQVSGGRSDG
jgi:hypothetical protein